jgi:hypothetical protein
MAMMACSNCLYFRPGARATTKDGVCRRNPPSQWTDESIDVEDSVDAVDEDGTSPLLTLHSTVTYTGWPDVASHDWCGEWSAPFDDDDPDLDTLPEG